MQRKTLLFVTDVFPWPLDRGQHVRVKNLLEACGRACDVTFVGPAPANPAHRAEVERHVARALYLEPLPNAWSARLALAARTARVAQRAPGMPGPATLRAYAPFVAKFAELDVHSFDFIWAERLHIARLCAEFASRTIVDLDDLEHVKVARRFAVPRSPKERLRDLYQYTFFRYLELSWSRRLLAALVCSDEDREYLEKHGNRNVRVVPNGALYIPPESEARAQRALGPGGPGTPLRIVFLGNVSHAPNRDAIAFFVDEILPILRTRAPNAALDVIGPNALPELAERYAGRVRFLGFVEDLGKALSDYDVLAAPLRFGGGTKLKVLDAMAHRIPVVTTAVGAEGLSLTHGEHAWIAQSADDIAQGVVRIKEDPALAERLATNAFSLVRDRFSWAAIQERLVEWLTGLSP